MGLFKKKQPSAMLKCPAKGCPFSASDSITLKRHTDWKHPELTQSANKPGGITK